MSPSRRFRFVQFEFAWPLGPDPGRYSIREHLGEGIRWIIVLNVLGAPERRLLRRRRGARDVPPGPSPSPVVTSRATLIDTVAMDGERAAEAWLRSADLEALASDAVARLNRVLHAQRVATADPATREVALSRALVVRIGYGDGERVADGRWERASELVRGSEPGPLRRVSLRPQERLAAVLAGRDPVLACEELALRARSDLDAERWREAALQLGVALDAALAELEPWRDQGGLGARLDELAARRAEVQAAATTALQGGIEEGQIAVVAFVLGRLEAALRARTAGGV